MIATGAHLGAPSGWIPGGIRPLNLRPLTHSLAPDSASDVLPQPTLLRHHRYRFDLEAPTPARQLFAAEAGAC